MLNEVSPDKNWAGSIRAMLLHHPDKFGKGKGKINAYALAWSEKKKGNKSHYKAQKSSKKGTPHKKGGFKEWLAINEAGQKIFGWLSPRGNFYQVDMFQHIEAVEKVPELKNLIPNFDDEVAALEHLRQWSNDQIEAGEHPDWHTYEMASDDFKYSIIKSLYNAGCLRVGSSGSSIHFEGKSPAISNLYQKAKDLAEEHGMQAVFEPKN